MLRDPAAAELVFLMLAQGAMCQSMEQIKLCGKLGALWQSVYGVSDDITPLEQLYSSSFAQVGHNGRAEQDCRLWPAGSQIYLLGRAAGCFCCAQSLFCCAHSCRYNRMHWLKRSCCTLAALVTPSPGDA